MSLGMSVIHLDQGVLPDLYRHILWTEVSLGLIPEDMSLIMVGLRAQLCVQHL